MKSYDRIADWYEAERSRDAGLADVRAVAAELRPGARVLDLGCGHGRPLTEALVGAGLQVFAIDSSREMVRRLKARCPGVRCRQETLQASDLFGGNYAAVIAWGLLFHLGARDQERALRKVARHLLPGGLFLFTAAQRAGTGQGTMNGVRFRYRSLGSAQYRRLLDEAGLTLVEEHDDTHGNRVFIARRRPPP